MATEQTVIRRKRDTEGRYLKSIAVQAKWERQRLPGLMAESASGLVVTDVTGKQYLDFSQSIVILGHSHPDIAKAVAKCVPDYLVGGTPGWSMMEPRLKLAEELKANLSGRLRVGKVAFCSSGAESCDYALGLARSYTRREIIISFAGAYHGFTGATLAVSSIEPHLAAHRGSSRTGNVVAPFPGDPDFADERRYERYCIDKFKELLQTVTTADEVAGMIFEPIEVNAGVRIPSLSFWREIFKTCHEHGILTIADEVFTGLGRTGKFLGIDNFGVEPDIVCFGKGVGGTLPLGVIVGRNEILDGHIKPNCNSASAGNPICCVAGYESLRVIKRDQLMKNSAEVGRYFKERLSELMDRHEIVADVRGLGLILGMEIGPRKEKVVASKRAERVMELGFEKGLLMSRVGIYDNVLRISPPMVVTKGQVDIFVDSMDEALAAL